MKHSRLREKPIREAVAKATGGKTKTHRQWGVIPPHRRAGTGLDGTGLGWGHPPRHWLLQCLGLPSSPAQEVVEHAADQLLVRAVGEAGHPSHGAGARRWVEAGPPSTKENMFIQAPGQCNWNPCESRTAMKMVKWEIMLQKSDTQKRNRQI